MFGCEPQIVIPSLRNYYEEWIERKISPLVRLSTAKRHRLCFEAIILPELAAALFQEITKTRPEAFRAKLLRGEDATRDDTHSQGRSQHC
jgi:hypothetical protein